MFAVGQDAYSGRAIMEVGSQLDRMLDEINAKMGIVSGLYDPSI